MGALAHSEPVPSLALHTALPFGYYKESPLPVHPLVRIHFVLALQSSALVWPCKRGYQQLVESCRLLWQLPQGLFELCRLAELKTRILQQQILRLLHRGRREFPRCHFKYHSTVKSYMRMSMQKAKFTCESDAVGLGRCSNQTRQSLFEVLSRNILA